MIHARDEILDWAAQGRLEPGRLREALEAGGALPTAARWRAFLDRLLLWGASAFLSVALVFFIAYNWEELGRWARFAMVELVFAGAVAGAWRLGLERAAGKACLFAASIAIGVLMALVGQTYQTGADPWELFALWAAAVVPFALAARLPVLWLLVLALANVAAILYFQASLGFFGVIFGVREQLWIVFGIDATALALWEALAARGAPWMQERWSARVVATASGGVACALGVMDVFGAKIFQGGGILAWAAWCAAAWFWYRHRRKDLFMLAGGALSVIVVVTTLLARALLDSRAEAGGLFLIGNAVIAMAAAAGWWLRKVALEEGE